MGLFPKLKIAQKLPILIVGSALLVSSGVGLASYLIASTAVESMSQRQLETASRAQATEFRTYLSSVETDLTITAMSEVLFQATRDFAINWGFFSTTVPVRDPAEALIEAYITNNPNPETERAALDEPTAILKTTYDFTHGKVHPTFRRQAEERRYDDLYLLDTLGNLVYSVEKSADFAGNFAEGGALADTGLGRAFRKAAAFTEPDQVAFEDFAPYASAGGEPSAFIATPVFRAHDMKLTGVLAFRISSDAMASLQERDTNAGTTADTFIVGSDFVLRSDSAGTEADDTLTAHYENSIVAEAVNGNSASGWTIDQAGRPVLATAVPLTFGGSRWAVVTTVAESEVYAPVSAMGSMILAVGGLLLVCVAAGGLVASGAIAKPITRLTRSIRRLAEGDLAVEVKGADQHDEVGEMARAVEVFRENAQQVRDMTEEDRAGSERRRLSARR